MKFRKRSNIILGILLILVGIWFMSRQLYPDLAFWGYFDFSWPWYVIGVGAFLILLGLLLGTPGMAVPACIVAGIGFILLWQNSTGSWESWSYAWTLIPGFVGVGIFLAELWGGSLRKALKASLPLIILSAVLFVVFGSYLGGLGILGSYWPLLLILVGAWLLLQPLLRRKAPSV